MEAAIEHPKPSRILCVSAQNFHWHQQRILHQVRVNHPVKDVHVTIVASRRKERLSVVEGNGPQCQSVVPGPTTMDMIMNKSINNKVGE